MIASRPSDSGRLRFSVGMSAPRTIKTHLGEGRVVSETERGDHDLEGALQALVRELGVEHVEGPTATRSTSPGLEEDEVAALY